MARAATAPQLTLSRIRRPAPTPRSPPDPGNPALDQKLEGFRIFSRNPQRYRRGRIAGSARAEEEALLAVGGAVKVGSRNRQKG